MLDANKRDELCQTTCKSRHSNPGARSFSKQPAEREFAAKASFAKATAANCMMCLILTVIESEQYIPMC